MTLTKEEQIEHAKDMIYAWKVCLKDISEQMAALITKYNKYEQAIERKEKELWKLENE